MEFISSPNYDIARVGLVCCPGVWSGVVARFPATPAAAAPGEFGGDGLPFGVNSGRTGANGGLVGPQVRVEPLRRLEQAVTLLGRTRPARDPVVEVRKPGPQCRRR